MLGYVWHLSLISCWRALTTKAIWYCFVSAKSILTHYPLEVVSALLILKSTKPHIMRIKLFSKKTKPVLEKPEETTVSVQEMSSSESYPKEVLEIHNEFMTAADRLVEEAKKIIEQKNTMNLSKISRLRKLGFKQSNEVSDAIPTIKKAELSEKQLSLLKVYQERYPLHKFITEEQVQQICHKYNLVCGDVERYKGFVPDVKLKEIESFVPKGPDEYSIYCTLRNGISFVIPNAVIRSTVSSISYTRFWHIHPVGSKDAMQYAFQSENKKDFYSNDSANLFGLAHLGSINFRASEATLKICAPVKDMDMTGIEVKDGYKLVEKFIPDPVVLRPVEGGYMILAAWGPEASDPLVVNERLN